MNPLKLREAFKLVILSQARNDREGAETWRAVPKSYGIRQRESPDHKAANAVAAKAVAGMNLRATGSNPVGDTITFNKLIVIS